MNMETKKEFQYLVCPVKDKKDVDNKVYDTGYSYLLKRKMRNAFLLAMTNMRNPLRRRGNEAEFHLRNTIGTDVVV